jgi:hypothetical protein
MFENRVLRKAFGTNKFGTNFASLHQSDDLKEGKTDGKFNTLGKGENCEYLDSRLA